MGPSLSSLGWKQSKGENAKLRVIIVGAGLAGLATAISCAINGHEVVVLESAKELAEVPTTCHYRCYSSDVHV